MLLTVLGCSGSIPGPNAPASGYLLTADGFRLGIELGNGTFAVLQSIMDPFDLDGLLFSHLHADHCADFSALSVLRRYHPNPPKDATAHKLDVFAPVAAPERFAAAYATDDADRVATDLTDVYRFHALRPGKIHIGPFEVLVAPAAHPCDAYSFRISQGGRTLAYTGDTGVTPALDEIVDGADVLLAEACWTHAPGDRVPDLHLSGTEAGELATQGAVGRLLVTHIPPWTDTDAVMAEVRAAYTGEVILVEQGAEYAI